MSCLSHRKNHTSHTFDLFWEPEYQYRNQTKFYLQLNLLLSSVFFDATMTSFIDEHPSNLLVANTQDFNIFVNTIEFTSWLKEIAKEDALTGWKRIGIGDL